MRQLRSFLVCVLLAVCVWTVIPLTPASAAQSPALPLSSSQKLAAPAKPTLSNVNGGIRIAWKKSSGAAKYRILYRVNGRGGWKKLVDTGKLSYTWRKAKSGTKYAFTIQALDQTGEAVSEYSKTGASITYLAAPRLKSLKLSGGSPVLTWSRSAGAVRYKVLRKAGTGRWAALGLTTDTRFTDKTAQTGVAYTYSVRCVSKNGKQNTSGYDARGLTITKCAEPMPVMAKDVVGAPMVSWMPSEGAVNYLVYRKAGRGSWERAGQSLGMPFYLDSGAPLGVQCIYKVCCAASDGKTILSAFTVSNAVTPLLSAPIPNWVTLSGLTATVNWKLNERHPEIKQYEVLFKADGGDWQSAGKTRLLTMRKSGLSYGKTYYFTVQGLDADGNVITHYFEPGLRLAVPAAPAN